MSGTKSALHRFLAVFCICSKVCQCTLKYVEINSPFNHLNWDFNATSLMTVWNLKFLLQIQLKCCNLQRNVSDTYKRLYYLPCRSRCPCTFESPLIMHEHLSFTADLISIYIQHPTNSTINLSTYTYKEKADISVILLFFKHSIIVCLHSYQLGLHILASFAEHANMALSL